MTKLQQAVRIPVRHARELSRDDLDLVVRTVDFHLAKMQGRAPTIAPERWAAILGRVRQTGLVAHIEEHEQRIIDNNPILTAELWQAIDETIPF